MTTWPLRQRRVCAGFTLAEVVVVLVILSILAAVTLPALRAPSRDPLADAAEEVARVLRTGRAAALASGAAVSVSIDPAGRTYLVERSTDSGPVAIGQGAFTIGRDIMLRGTLPRARFRFERQGTAAQDSIVLVGSSGLRPVALNRWTGEPVLSGAGAEAQ